MSHHAAYTLALLCASGGLMGYLKRKSTASLIAGLTFGGLYGVSGYLLASNADYGVELATVTSGVLLSAMGPRAARTRKPVPLMLTVLGLLGSGYYGKKWYEFKYGV